jgi:hypothetical protein
LVTRLAGRFRLKGFEKAVEVYELIGWPANEGDSRVWRDCFAEALLAFQRGNLDAAEKGFRRTLELHPGDGPSDLYLSRLAELRKATLPPGWNGEIELKEK